MTWVTLSCLSALFLGIYDLLKKVSLKDNAVVPVLFLSVLSGAAVWTPVTIWSSLAPDAVPWPHILRVDSLPPAGHIQMAFKALIVGLSWIFAYFAVKHLPVSIAAPIRATAPIWTITMAVAFMGERPSNWQWLGVVIVLGAFYAFSFVGKLEGIHFHRDRWVGCMVIATVLGATSALYDKYLLQNLQLTTPTVQGWFSIYLVIVLLPFLVWWKFFNPSPCPFHWRWSIPLIGLTLLVTDFLYFSAIRDPEALISVISPIRRSAVAVSFLGAFFLFDEKNLRIKFLLILVILSGIFLLNWKS